MKAIKVATIVLASILSAQAWAGGQHAPGERYEAQDILPEQYHPESVHHPAGVPSPGSAYHQFSPQGYERYVQDTQQSYQIVPGIVYYPSPNPRPYYYGRRVYDPCFVHPRRSARVVEGVLLDHAEHGFSETQATGAMLGASAGAYIAGRIVGGNC